MANQTPFLSMLAGDPELARHAGFALFAGALVGEAGLLQPATGAAAGNASAAADDFARFPELVRAIARANPHLLPFFRDGAALARLKDVHEAGWRELRNWLRTQHLAGADAQVAYELGALALGVELPPILVGDLRTVRLEPDFRVAELPNGSGYPTVLLGYLHPEFDAGRQVHLFVENQDAEALAAWALVVLTRRLVPPPGAIERVSESDRDRLRAQAFDLVLAYHPVPWLRDHPERAVTARRVLLL